MVLQECAPQRTLRRRGDLWQSAGQPPAARARVPAPKLAIHHGALDQGVAIGKADFHQLCQLVFRQHLGAFDLIAGYLDLLEALTIQRTERMFARVLGSDHRPGVVDMPPADGSGIGEQRIVADVVLRADPAAGKHDEQNQCEGD